MSLITLAGKFRIENADEGLVLEIKVAKSRKGVLDGFTSFFGVADKEPPLGKNQVDIRLFKMVGKERLLFEEGKGNYARHLELGGRVYYPVPNIDFPAWTVEQKGKNTLPSSAVLRKDISLLKADNLKDATMSGH